jgi:hypothetical protein
MKRIFASHLKPRFRRFLLPLAGAATFAAVFCALQVTRAQPPRARNAAAPDRDVPEAVRAREAPPTLMHEQAQARESRLVESPAAAGEAVTARIPSLNPASELAEMAARRFSSVDEERSVWSERLRGERLTLQNQRAAAERAERVLENGAAQSGVELSELTRRQALLKAKIDAQSQRVAWLEKRVGVLAQN